MSMEPGLSSRTPDSARTVDSGAARAIPTGLVVGGIGALAVVGVAAALVTTGVIPGPFGTVGGGAADGDLGVVDSNGVVAACSLLTDAEAGVYAGDVVEVHGSSPAGAETHWSHDCHWWDDTSEGFSVVVSYGGAWDFTPYDDPSWLTDIVEFDGLAPYEAVLHMPNDEQLELGHVTADLVKAIEVRKGEHIALFYGRQMAGTLTLGSRELDDFLGVIAIAMERVPD